MEEPIPIEVPTAIAPMPVPAPQPPPEPEAEPPKKKVSKKKAQAAMSRVSPGKDVQRHEDAATIGNYVIDLGLAGQGIFRMHLELDEIDYIRARLKRKIEDAEADEKAGKLTVEQELQLAETRAVLVKLGIECAHDLIKANPPQNPQGQKPASPWQPFPANVVVVQNANAPVEPKPIDS